MSERHPSSQRFHQILQEMGELHDRKQADYGTKNDPFANVRASQDFGVVPWIGALIRENDKTNRVKSFIANGSLKNESLEDSLLDKAVYCVIALVLWEEGGKQSPDPGGGQWITLSRRSRLPVLVHDVMDGGMRGDIVICGDCVGRGEYPGADTCDQCDGTGTLHDPYPWEVPSPSIPQDQEPINMHNPDAQ